MPITIDSKHETIVGVRAAFWVLAVPNQRFRNNPQIETVRNHIEKQFPVFVHVALRGESAGSKITLPRQHIYGSSELRIKETRGERGTQWNHPWAYAARLGRSSGFLKLHQHAGERIGA